MIPRRTTSALLLLLNSSTLLSCTATDHHSTPADHTERPPTTATTAPTDLAAPSPVTASLRTDQPQLAPGGHFNAVIDLRIAPGWYIHAADRPAAEAISTSIQLELPSGVEPAGEGSSPEPATIGSATGAIRFIYHGNSVITFQRPLRIAADAPPGPKTIRCTVEYQACNRFVCEPPARVTLETTVHTSG